MYKTIIAPICDTLVVKKSKFITHIVPISSEEEAKAFIEQIKKEHRQANHNVPVYVLGQDYYLQRYSDDGEPSGTAGVPILDMYKKQGITNICSVVTRYFGGIKLGTGGLVRAYTECVQQLIQPSLVVVDSYQRLALVLPYHLHGKTEYLIANSSAHVVDTHFTDCVSMLLYILENESTSLVKSLIELSNNQIGITQAQVHGAIVDGKFIEM